jgi:Glyoxalase-like domain
VSAGGGLELDHVLLATLDLDEAAHELETRHGLATLAGGRHPGWGTTNRIVPLGNAYLEIVAVAVADEPEAASTTFGRWVRDRRRAPYAPLGWAVRSSTLDGHAARLGLTVQQGERERPDGTFLRWRLAGVDRAAADPFLPFLIEWAPGTTLPGRAAASHAAGAVRVALLELGGSARLLAAWLGESRLPVAVHDGSPGVSAVVLDGDAGEIVLGES